MRVDEDAADFGIFLFVGFGGVHGIFLHQYNSLINEGGYLQTSFGHFILIGSCSYPLSYVFIPLTTAIAARY